MALITDRTTLKTAITDYLAKSNLTSFVDNFLQNAENKLNRSLNLRNEETALDISVSSGVGAVPSDFKALKLAYADKSPAQWLDVVTLEQLYRDYPVRSGSGDPLVIAREGSNFIFGPYPSDFTLKGIYYAKQPISSDTVTNILLHSQDLSTTWVNTRSTDSQAVGTAPDNSLTANSINEDGTAASNHFIEQSFTATDNEDYTFSCYLKASNRTAGRLNVVAQDATSYAADFDLSNGTILSTTADPIETTITDEGNGWYRCRISVNIGAGATAEGVFILPTVGTNSIFDGLSQESILVWGAQLETGLVLHDYIATTTASVTTTGTDSWYVLNAPEVLLYGALLEAEPFIRADQRIPVWREFFNDAIETLRIEEMEAARGRTGVAARLA